MTFLFRCILFICVSLLFGPDVICQTIPNHGWAWQEKAHVLISVRGREIIYDADSMHDSLYDFDLKMTPHVSDVTTNTLCAAITIVMENPETRKIYVIKDFLKNHGMGLPYLFVSNKAARFFVDAGDLVSLSGKLFDWFNPSNLYPSPHELLENLQSLGYHFYAPKEVEALHFDKLPVSASATSRKRLRAEESGDSKRESGASGAPFSQEEDAAGEVPKITHTPPEEESDPLMVKSGLEHINFEKNSFSRTFNHTEQKLIFYLLKKNGLRDCVFGALSKHSHDFRGQVRRVRAIILHVHTRYDACKHCAHSLYLFKRLAKEGLRQLGINAQFFVTVSSRTSYEHMRDRFGFSNSFNPDLNIHVVRPDPPMPYVYFRPFP